MAEELVEVEIEWTRSERGTYFRMVGADWSDDEISDMFFDELADGNIEAQRSDVDFHIYRQEN